MKRQVSISIFLAILLIFLVWLYIKNNNLTEPKQNIIQTENEFENEQSVTISQEYKSSKFYVKEEYGKIVIYDTNSNMIFMETSIELFDLPLDLQEKIDQGIFFQSELELYDFLESYSS